MALIVEYMVVADMYPVGTSAITAGMILTLHTDGTVIPAPTGTSSPKSRAIGIAGDSALAAAGVTTAYSDTVTIGAGGTRYTSNRVSDFYNETTASQKITVYNGGGKFWISSDLFDANVTVPGTPLGVSNATAGEWEETSVADDDICAIAAGVGVAYPSGVPGSDISGSITLGNFIPIVLRL